MNRPAQSLGIGIAVFLLWYFVALEVMWTRTGMGIALGVSIALNAALLFWVAAARRSVDAPTNRVQSTR